MRRKILTKIVIILLVIQSGLISSIPLVLCFNEDGHVQLEIKQNSIHENHTKQCKFSENKPGEICFKNKDKKGCENCYDIPILFTFTAYTNINRLNKFLVNQYSFFNIYSTISFIEKRNFNDIISLKQTEFSYDKILLKMSFLI